MNDAYFGQLIRGIHYWSANFLLALIGLHMAQVFFSGGYKAPRELNWIVGVVLLLLVIGLAFTGYLLRWDQDGFWASVVGMKIGRSEEHTSELQSRQYLVCRLLLEKKKKKKDEYSV